MASIMRGAGPRADASTTPCASMKASALATAASIDDGIEALAVGQAVDRDLAFDLDHAPVEQREVGDLVGVVLAAHQVDELAVRAVREVVGDAGGRKRDEVAGLE